MAWEQRGSGRYYYESYRNPETGKVCKRYVGTGPAAEAAARRAAARKAERAARRRADEERRHADAALSSQVDSVVAEADALMEAALLAAGYCRPQRKRWRKRKS